MPGDLLDANTATRLAAARAGADLAVRLRLGDLKVGMVGVVEAEVRAVAPVRKYQRKRGGEGMLVRVTLADRSGEADLVLWDDEVRLAKDGPLQPGAQVRIHGPLVKAGRDARSPLELGLSGAEVVPMPGAAEATVTGLLLAIGPTRPVGEPPAMRFTCEITLQAGTGPLHAVVWDAAVKAALAAGVGARVELRGRPNPFLDGWWTATSLGAATVGRGDALGFAGPPDGGPAERNP
ncbi:MAG: hypothetical protein AABY18_06490 [Candidatus Thermoplasmatota archaeon]